ncbi:hypothetical protein QBC39DRAFT_401919 [Podospora conica]|nr:hypothetical protein QBC39DRAFT_401919 [Schizothecium conicum]
MGHGHRGKEHPPPAASNHQPVSRNKSSFANPSCASSKLSSPAQASSATFTAKMTGKGLTHSGDFPNLLDMSDKQTIHKICRAHWPESQEYADGAEPHVKRRESGLACAIIVLRALFCQLPPAGRRDITLDLDKHPLLAAALLLDCDESMRLARDAVGSRPIGFRSLMESDAMLRWSLWRRSPFGRLFSPSAEALATRPSTEEEYEQGARWRRTLVQRSLLNIEAPSDALAPAGMTEAVREACNAVIRSDPRGAQIWAAPLFMRIRFNARNNFDPLGFSLCVGERIASPDGRVSISPPQEHRYQCFAAVAISSPDGPTVELYDFDGAPMPAPIGSPWAATGLADSGMYMLYFKRLRGSTREGLSTPQAAHGDSAGSSHGKAPQRAEPKPLKSGPLKSGLRVPRRGPVATLRQKSGPA